VLESIAAFLSSLHIDSFVGANDWVWPVCEILHFSGMCVLLGTVGVVDLRILGVGKGIPIQALDRFIPLGVIAFAVNLLTGFIFIAGNTPAGPLEYLENLSLQIKLLLVLIAGINLLVFYFTGIHKKIGALDADAVAPRSAKVVATVSLVMWFGVIFFGRMIMYNDTLLYLLGI
jgi:hypothetical protein